MIPDRFSLPDLLLGAIVVVIGAAVVYISFDYPAGTTALMGPGYMPRATGAILMALGLAVLVRSAGPDGEPLPRFELRAALFVTLGVLAFAFLIGRFGFVPAVVAATILSSLANPRARFWSTLVLSALLAVLTSAIFVWGLNLNAELFRWPNF